MTPAPRYTAAQMRAWLAALRHEGLQNEEIIDMLLQAADTEEAHARLAIENDALRAQLAALTQAAEKARAYEPPLLHVRDYDGADLIVCDWCNVRWAFRHSDDASIYEAQQHHPANGCLYVLLKETR